jgi:3-isopropylmalate/(R)-2-methylmalate dehydratase small subunit
MRPIQIIEGRMVPLDRADVDTDQIMPVQFLKRPERTGFAKFLFFNWMDEPDFVLNDDRYNGANVLVSGPNFGCGSSREHAPWGLQEYGFEAIIAPSFGDIFRVNCTKIGLLCAQPDAAACKELIMRAAAAPATRIQINLAVQTITVCEMNIPFEVDAYSKWMLSEGIDHIDLTLKHADAIAAFEAARFAWLPATGPRAPLLPWQVRRTP